MNGFGIICAILSFLIGTQDVEQSMIAKQFGPFWYHALNVVMGYAFGAALITFFNNLGKVIEAAGIFAKWLIMAAISLMISGAYLVLQFYRIYVW